MIELLILVNLIASTNGGIPYDLDIKELIFYLYEQLHSKHESKGKCISLSASNDGSRCVVVDLAIFELQIMGPRVQWREVVL